MISSYFSNIIYYFEWLAFITSINCFKPIYPRPMRLFALVLFCILVAEVIALYMAQKYNYNGIVYNILDFVWFPGYMFIFSKLVTNLKFKKYIRITLTIFYLFAIINFAWIQNDHRWLAHRTFVVGSISVVFCSLLALLEITNAKKRLNIATEPIFWISVSMMFYFFPSSIVVSGFDYFEMKDIPISDAYGKAFKYSQKYLNVIHYSLMSYAFLCLNNITHKNS